MKFSKGTVKKYSREYSRTLKNGKKKKYKTEQIQITVPKQEDIFFNEEEVLIIPESEKETIELCSEIINSVELSNYLLENENKKLKKDIKKYEKELINPTQKEEYDSLKKEYDKLIDDYCRLEEKFNDFKNNEKYNDYLINRFKEFILNSG